MDEIIRFYAYNQDGICAKSECQLRGIVVNLGTELGY